MAIKLSPLQLRALEFLVEKGGSVLEYQIPEANARDEFGYVVPGIKVYRQLEEQGLLFTTDEEPFDLPGDPLDGFQFTPDVVITDEGKAAYAESK